MYVNPKKQGTAKQIICYLLVINGFQKVVHWDTLFE